MLPLYFGVGIFLFMDMRHDDLKFAVNNVGTGEESGGAYIVISDAE